MNTISIENKNYGDGVTKSPKDIYRMVVRRLNLFTVAVSTIMVIAVGLAIFLPSEYRSTATILIEQQEIPQDLVRSTVTSYADQRVQVISQHVMTRSNLVEIIDRYDLYADDRKLEPLEVILDEMRADINMSMLSADVVDPRSGRPTQATIAFTLSYNSESPDLAQKVANELTSLYLNENLKERSKRTTEAEVFLNDEAKRLSRQIAELEVKMASFKEKNIDSLPQLMDMNLQLIERTERDLIEVERQVRALKERKVYLESELAQLNPNLAVISEDGQRMLSPRDRLKALETEYTGLMAIYSQSHPDIIRIRKQIDVFKQKLANGKNALKEVSSFNNEVEKELYQLRDEYDVLRGKYAADHPDVRRIQSKIHSLEEISASYEQSDKTSQSSPALESLDPDNPAYIQLQAQLEAAETELSSLFVNKEELKTRIEKYENRISKSPQVERQYKSLSRDYDNSWAKYQEVKAKQMEANLAKNLEIEQKGERFTLIDPPPLPEEAISPNRSAILFLGLVMALGLGFGLTFYVDSMDKSIRSTSNVWIMLDAQPLAEVPIITNTNDETIKSRKKIITITVLLLLVIAGILVIHFFKIPLDVLWYILQRRMGIALS